MIEPGSLVSHYRIDREIGRGATAHVYRATDVNGGRAVALKVPHADPGPDTIRRFLREVRLTARLVHPNVVAVLGGFEHAGLPWLVLQLVDGVSLGEIIDAGGPLPLTDAVRHGKDLASALAFAHARGVLHRDVSPNNILIAADGRAKLSDFGLASVASSAPGTREPSRRAVVGTAGYMAPETIVGHAPDGRSDLFSLGAVLYEMCTGRPAFPGGTSEERLDATLEREPAEMGVPQLESIVKRALAKSPDERYSSAGELEDDLRTALS